MVDQTRIPGGVPDPLLELQRGEAHARLLSPLNAGELIDWWVAVAKADAEACIPKALEYGSSDLIVIGAGLCPQADDAQRIEAAIGFYASGKTARIVGAHMEGRSPSDDSWADLSVYSMMGRYTREHGRWT